MKILEGSPVSPGFARGIAIVCDYEVERKVTLPDRDRQAVNSQAVQDGLKEILIGPSRLYERLNQQHSA